MSKIKIKKCEIVDKFFKKRKCKRIAYVFIVFVVVVSMFLIKNISKKNIENNYSSLEMGILENEEEENKEEEKNNNEDKKEEKIYVHIAGEIKNKGVYLLEKGSRIKDIIEMAGGITEKGDLENINLAEILEDEMKIDIPNKNEKVDEKTKEKVSEKNIVQKGNTNIKKIKININSATKEELESITGVGPSTADKIISYRKENGKFKSIEDLKNVKGIGKTKFEKMKIEIEI